MKESEAKQKWCPFSRNIGDSIRVPHNRYLGKPSPTSCCLGSECMAWREYGKYCTKKDEELSGGLYAEGDIIPDGGYCGLTRVTSV